MRKRPIAIYDSGVGGLSIVKVLKEWLPQESIHYIGDTKHLPYGDRSGELLCHYFRQVIDFCLPQGYKLLVIACHTATAAAACFLPAYVQSIRAELPIINVIDPILTHITTTKCYQRLGLIGTNYTVACGMYQERLAAMDVTAFATPLLASMVETSFQDGKIDEAMVNDYLSPFQTIDAFIPACTHYHFLEPTFQKFFKNNFQNEVEIIPAAALTAKAIQQWLMMHHLLNDTKERARDCFMATAWTAAFHKAIQKLFGFIPVIVDLGV